MELDDLKRNWSLASTEIENQPHLTSHAIILMTKKNVASKIEKIAYPEFFGILVCVTSVLFIALKFDRLESWSLQVAGIAAIFLLLGLSMISLLSLRKLDLNGDVMKPYAATLQEFATRKLQFHKLQKLNITLGYLLLVTMIPLLTAFSNGHDLSGNKYYWILSFPVGYIFLSFFSRLVTRFYSKTLKEAEELLAELEQA